MSVSVCDTRNVCVYNVHDGYIDTDTEFDYYTLAAE